MSANISLEHGDEHFEQCEIRASELTAEGKQLAEVLWGIERFGTSGAENPPPIYTDMAWQLQTDPALRLVLSAALKVMRNG